MGLRGFNRGCINRLRASEESVMGKLITIFKSPELRTKIFFTLGLLMIYRLGFWVPLPFVDQESMRSWAENMGSDLNRLLSTVSMFSGSDIGNATIFGL